MLSDPKDYVRAAAIRSPRLPARVLSRLLHDRDTAYEAATNPAIPVPVLYRLLAAAAGRGSVTSREQEVDRLLGLGATLVAGLRNSDGSDWAVLADPNTHN
ncbi:hypothetical protein [Streptomyces sp. NPDC056628]|uniref:hypothetical protein n=1 Tax=Streptomyces sp. NPDC056628 TaxID=3345882 RepID=UPI00367A766F